MIVAEHQRQSGDQHKQAGDERRANLPADAGQPGQKRQPTAQNERNREPTRKEASDAFRAEEKNTDEEDEYSEQNETADVTVCFCGCTAYAPRRDELPERCQLLVQPDQPARRLKLAPPYDPYDI